MSIIDISDPSLPPDPETMDAIYRSDFIEFAMRCMRVLEPGTNITPNWHHKVIGNALSEARLGIVRRLVINQPPKTLKTHLVSVCYTLWLLLHNPGMKIAIISHDEVLAAKIVRQIRQILKSPWYSSLAPNTVISKDKDSETVFETTAGGEVRAFSVNGGITGHGFDVIIIDDPQKASTAHSEVERENVVSAYKSAISSRFKDPSTGILIVVMQRLHVDDFSAFILKTHSDVRHLSIPARATKTIEYEIGENQFHTYKEGELLEPDRLTETYLADQRKIQGFDYFSAQYMQNPQMSAGRIIDINWFKTYDKPREHELRIVTIDPAFSENKGDMSAAIVCGITGDEFEVLHAEQVQRHFVGVLTWINGLDELFKPDLFAIETIGAGHGFPHALGEYGIKHVFEVGKHGRVSKQARMEIASHKIEQGKIWLPREAPWLDDFLAHIAEFPHGPGDDWADALSQLIIYLNEISSWARFHKAQRAPPPEPQRQTGLRRGMHYQRFEFT